METLIYSEIVKKECVRFLTGYRLGVLNLKMRKFCNLPLVSSSHVRSLFYLRNCDILLTTELETWHGQDHEVLPGIVLLLLTLKFGMENYHQLDSKLFDNIFGGHEEYQCNWKNAYSSISNSYSSTLMQMKPSNNKDSKSRRTYHNTPTDDGDNLTDDELTLVTHKVGKRLRED